eukprot:scaffold32541_cov76-Phaeocystis_antarctica.AAC.1
MEDCLAYSHKPLTWLITPGQLEQRLTVPEMTLRVNTVIRCSGACEAPPADRRDGPDGRCRAKPSPLLR